MADPRVLLCSFFVGDALALASCSTCDCQEGDAAAVVQPAIVNVSELSAVSGGGGLIHTTSG